MKEDGSTFYQYTHQSSLQHPSSISPISGTVSRSLEEIEMETGTKAEQRKSNKPVMEKRRRARINNCLNDLKAILLEAMRKDPARHSKLEKADILELTVRHLQNVQRTQLALAMANDPTVVHRFKNGFSECATEVSRYLSRLELGDPSVKTRVSTHLSSCINGLSQVNPASYPAPPQPASLPFIPPPPYPPSSDSNNNKPFQRFTPTVIQTAQPTTTTTPQQHNSAFTSVPPSFMASPQSITASDLNSSTSASDTSLSFSSDKGVNTSPIDFSLKPTPTPRILLAVPPSTGPTVGIRVVKVEPLGKRTGVMTTVDKTHMWRPW